MAAAAVAEEPLAWLFPPPPVSVLRRYAMARRSCGATVRPKSSLGAVGATPRRGPYQRDQQARGPRASHQRDACGRRSSTHTLRVVHWPLLPLTPRPKSRRPVERAERPHREQRKRAGGFGSRLGLAGPRVASRRAAESTAFRGPRRASATA